MLSNKNEINFIENFKKAYCACCLWWLIPFIVDFSFLFSADGLVSQFSLQAGIFSLQARNELEAALIIAIFLGAIIALFLNYQAKIASFTIFVCPFSFL